MRLRTRNRWLLGLLSLVGCTQIAPTPAAARPEVSGASLPSAHAAVQQDSHRDAVAKAYGLSPLHNVELPAGSRELRLWPHSGPGIPNLFVRILDQGDRASAEWIAYWQRDPSISSEDRAFYDRFHHQMRERWRCGPIRREGPLEVCLLASHTGASAQALAARLDSLSIWSHTIPSPQEPAKSIQIDGRGLDVEILQAGQYQHVRFGQHQIKSDSLAAALDWFARHVGG